MLFNFCGFFSLANGGHIGAITSQLLYNVADMLEEVPIFLIGGKGEMLSR